MNVSSITAHRLARLEARLESVAVTLGQVLALNEIARVAVARSRIAPVHLSTNYVDKSENDKGD